MCTDHQWINNAIRKIEMTTNAQRIRTLSN